MAANSILHNITFLRKTTSMYGIWNIWKWLMDWSYQDTFSLHNLQILQFIITGERNIHVIMWCGGILSAYLFKSLIESSMSGVDEFLRNTHSNKVFIISDISDLKIILSADPVYKRALTLSSLSAGRWPSTIRRHQQTQRWLQCFQCFLRKYVVYRRFWIAFSRPNDVIQMTDKISRYHAVPGMVILSNRKIKGLSLLCIT